MRTRLAPRNAPGLIAIIVVGGLTTVGVWRSIRHMERERVRQEFFNRAHDLETAIARQVESALLRLEALTGYYNGSQTVERDEFQRFTAQLLSGDTAIQALGWSPRVFPHEREAYEQAARAEGLPDFQFTERNAAGELVRRAEAGIYLPVYYIEPLETNRPALGFDLASNSDRLAALERAKTTGDPVATAPITLVQETTTQKGVLVYLPVYRRPDKIGDTTSAEARDRQLQGFVSGVFRTGDLLRLALSDLDMRAITIDVYDATDSAAPELIFQAGSPTPAETAHIGSPGMPGRNWRVEIRSGRDFWVAHRGVAPFIVFPAGLMITGMLALFYTQSLRQQYLAGNRRFRQVVEAFPQAVTVVNENGEVTLANRACEALFGYPEEELVGQPMRQFTLRSPPGEASESVPPPETLALHRDGRRIPVEIVQGPVDTTDGPQTVAIIADITLRTEAERRRREYERKLEQSNQELQQFAYVASHDLQAPLRSIGSFTDLLQTRYADLFDEQAAGWMQRVLLSVKTMESLIEDLLGFSRLNTLGKPFAPVKIVDVVDEALHHLHSAIADSGASVTLTDREELPTIQGDRTQLIQLFQNLIGNAIKYRRPDQTPRVEIAAEPDPEKGGWLFTVRDNGIGIAPEHRERIFEIFRRLHSASDYPGSGIGLAVCRRVAQRHGGEIWLGEESRAGGGSAFCFRLGA